MCVCVCVCVHLHIRMYVANEQVLTPGCWQLPTVNYLWDNVEGEVSSIQITVMCASLCSWGSRHCPH